MAMNAGMGLSKAVILLGAGFTGSIMMRNGKLADILGELQFIFKGLERPEGSSGADVDDSALVSQIDRLTREVQTILSSRQPSVVLLGNGGSSQLGNLKHLVLSAASLGAVGCGYMWWKGLCFSDLMYVTKRNMATAVSSMTEHMQQLSDTLAAAKRLLTQRIQNLDEKLDQQKEISKDIRNEVGNARGEISSIGYDLNSLQQLICGLSDKMDVIEDKQNFAASGVMYLCRFIHDKGGKVPEFLENAPKTSSKRSFIFSENASLKGLQHITSAVETGIFDKFRIQESDNILRPASSLTLA